jgi:triacylglycerol lipase
MGKLTMLYLRKLFWLILIFVSSIGCVYAGATPRNPIVFIHGMLASGDTYSGQLARFEANGYDPSLLHLFDWNSLSFGRGNALNELDAFVDSVRALAGGSKVFLVGHSAGSGLVYNYCKDAARTDKVNGVVLIGGFAQDTTAGHNHQIPTMNIYSTADLVAKGGADVPGAANVKLEKEDHYEVATGMAAFNAMYQFITKADLFISDAVYTDQEVVLAGKAVTLGDNTPLRGGSVQVFQVDATTGKRMRKKPDGQFMVDHLGNWGPMKAILNASYEFVARGADSSAKPIHYFREKVKQSNRNIYLRVIPNSGMLTMMFSGLPSDSCPALAVFSASQAILNGRDSLTIDGTKLTGTDFFKPSRTTIAMFLYDGNKNGKSDLNGVGLFNMQGVFLAGIDMVFRPNETPIILEFNGRTLAVRRIPSKDGVVVPVFD